MRRTQHHNVAEVPFDQPHAAQDERAHQDRAQLRVSLNKGLELLARQLKDFARLKRSSLKCPDWFGRILRRA